MSTLPPGPRSTTLQTLEYIRDPFGTLEKYARRYGDPFTLRPLAGPMVVTGSPEGIREIFTADPNTFERSVASFLEPLVGSHSLPLLEGAAHKRMRALIMPLFHGARMKTYGHVMQEIALRHAAEWRPDRVFRMVDTTQAISLDVIMETIFGIRNKQRLQLFEDTILEFFRAYTAPLVLFPWLRRGFAGIGAWSRFQNVAARFDQLILDEIAARRQELGDRDDILSLLLAARYEDGGTMTNEEVRDELKTLLNAGHKNTAVSLAWAFYWLQREPQVAERLQTELAQLGPSPDPERLAQLPYLGAVCNEALRLYPVLGTTLVRRLRLPFRLRGYQLPAGMAVAAVLPLPHFDSALYPDPMRFRPERFLERKFTPFEYLPFGGGARRCVGAAFATYEMKIVLGSILARHRLALAEDKPVRHILNSFTIYPKGGVKMSYAGPVNR